MDNQLAAAARDKTDVSPWIIGSPNRLSLEGDTPDKIAL